MRALLLRLYPPGWRARYGEEFLALLEERPLGPFDVADVLLGALDAQLNLRGPSAASPIGGLAMSLRLGGSAAILGGLLWFVVLLFNAVNQGRDGGATLIGWVLLVAIVVTLVALVGLSAFQARRHPTLIWAATALPAAGAIVSLVGAMLIAVGGDSDREIVAGFSAWAISTIGVMALVAGSALFAIATWWTRALPRPAAALLAVGAVLVPIVLMGVSGGIFGEALAVVALIASFITFPGGWLALGVSALRAGPRTAAAGA